MWLKHISHSQLFVAFLLFYYNVMPTSANNVAQLKNQQQALGQQTSTQHQHHTNHVNTQTHHQQQQQISQSGGIAAHPAHAITSGTKSLIHDSNTGHHTTETQALESTLPATSTSAFANLPSPQYVVHDKEIAMQEILKHFNRETGLNDPYKVLNELKRETQDNKNHVQPPPPPFVALHPNSMMYPWNLYDRPYAPISLPPPQMPGLFPNNFNPFEAFSTPFPGTPRFLPIMSYSQPVYVPYPFIVSPDMLYPSYSSLPQMANDYEDSMSRGAGTSRRPGSSQHSTSFPRNSPIYYVRLPPTPYMFLPDIDLSSRSTSMAAYTNMLPYQSLPPFSPFSSILNVPINFLANGRPTNIYQMSAPPNDIQNHLQFSNIPSSFSTRPPPPPPPPNAYRPVASAHNYFSAQPSSTSSSSNYGLYHGSSSTGPASPAPSSSSALPHQDSKLTSLKHPYFFNGRPDDIYILPNNFNTLFSSDSSYY